MEGILDLSFKGARDFSRLSNLAGCCPREKRLEEGPFLVQGQVFLAPPARDWRFNRRQPPPIGGGDDAAHGTHE
jgi:hypothetical protein